jgi:hypothetical protein
MTTPTWGTPTPAPESKPSGARRKVAIALGIGAVALVAFALGSSGGQQGVQDGVAAALATPAPTASPTPEPTPEPTVTPEPTPEPPSDSEAFDAFTLAVTGDEFDDLSDAFGAWTEEEWGSNANAPDVVEASAALVAVATDFDDVRPCFASYRDDVIAFMSAAGEAAEAALDDDMDASLAALSSVSGIDLELSREQAEARCDGDPVPTATPEPVAESVKVSGRGTSRSKPFALVAGDYDVVISGKATGMFGGNVIMDLALKGGDGYFDNEMLFNEIADKGKYRYSTTVYGIEAGDYYLDGQIMPSGTWTVTLKPIP